MNFFAIPLFYWIKQEIYYYKNNDPLLFLEFLGKFSYSIYLCHGVALFIFMIFIHINIYNYIFIYLFGIIISYIYYILIEKPSHKLAVNLSNRV